MKRILLTGGGTGGHIYPALSIAKEIKKRYPDVSIGYIGTSTGLESRIVSKEEDIHFHTIDIQGFRRKLSWYNIQTVVKFFRAVRISRKIITDFRPEVVIGTGGYVSGPPVYAAYRLGIPTLIHEQNVIPGLTTSFLSRFSTTTAISFEQSEQLVKSRHVVYTGNPRATDVMGADPRAGRASIGITDPEKKIVLLVGGSQGAGILRKAVMHMLPYFGRFSSTHFVYVTGEAQYDSIRKDIPLGIYANLDVRPFIYNMPDVLAASHFIVSRAGASTLAEITSLGVPSILIPSPYVTNNHQLLNARWLEKHGACKIIEEKNCTGKALWSLISELMRNDDVHRMMSDAARKLGVPRSAAMLVDELEKLV